MPHPPHVIPANAGIQELEAIRQLLGQTMLRDRYILQNRLRKLEQRPGSPDLEEACLKLLLEVEESVKLRQVREAQEPLLNLPEHLPIALHAEEIIELLQRQQVLVIAGETGSGKTTQLPKLCWQAGFGRQARIACTQPRRVAATSIARQVARELQTEVGAQVGYRIRFGEKTSAETLIQFMTDGMLLAETQHDRFLNAYDVIILDEAHERSLNIDFLLGYLKQLLPRRPDLRLVITSASIDTERFSQAFGQAPVLEVSGRSFPVEVHWSPLDPRDEESGERTVLDAAVEATREALAQPHGGDILVFLPGEQEIREVVERLSGGTLKQAVDVLPLFGRLTAAEQNRIFQSTGRRKVVVATNLAETSLTLPGITTVIDSGLQRIARYSPRQRIQRLPVELIAQSNALQRAGRAGRTAPGICVRLYSEETFRQLRDFAEPEILRSNLAGVILQMLHLRLGNPKASGVDRIRNFPFIDPPGNSAIKEGFKLLRELGAVDEELRLTPMGRQMARLPIEPTTARMLLHARGEQAMNEVLIIAAGLSVQDPREYPQEKQAEARAMHKSFVHPDSDFLTLLNIWNAYHDEWDALRSENKLRKFCKAHFLSFVRMREWRDIHRQLERILGDSGLLERNEQPADYRAVHCSILSGLLSQIGQKTEKNQYRTGGGKEVFIFPGSALHGKGGSWILAAEQVETSRLYARKVANIDVRWLEALGGDLCRRSYADPFFNEESGIVQAYERVTLHGLPIVSRRRVAYGRINPVEATELFIREALVGDRLQSNLPFLRHNRQLKQRLLDDDAKLRRNRLDAIEAAVEAFYTEQLSGVSLPPPSSTRRRSSRQNGPPSEREEPRDPGTSRRGVSSVHDLNRLVRHQRHSRNAGLSGPTPHSPEKGPTPHSPEKGNPRFLFMNEADLLAVADEESPHPEAFPDFWSVGSQRLALKYVYAPGEESDGATLQLSDLVVPHLRAPLLDWLIPGQWEDRIQHLLRALPKAERRRFVPIPDAVRRLAARMEPGEERFLETLSRAVRKEFGVHLPPEQWDWERLPEHLKPRVELRDNTNQVLARGRNIEELLSWRRAELKKIATQYAQDQQLDVLKEAERTWNLDQLTDWSFDELPDRVQLDTVAGVPIHAYPGLLQNEHGVHRRLFATREEAREATPFGLRHLLALATGPDLAWLEKDLSELRELRDELSPFGSVSELKADLRDCVHAFLFEGSWISTREQFEQRAQEARIKLRTLSPRVIEMVERLLEAYRETQAAVCAVELKRGSLSAPLKSHLAELMPRRFPRSLPYARWNDTLRYLKALRIRAERLELDPLKDESKAAQLDPWPGVLRQLQCTELASGEARHREEFRWMLEELRVSVFAPELRTAFPISAKRLEKFATQHLTEHLRSQ